MTDHTAALTAAIKSALTTWLRDNVTVLSDEAITNGADDLMTWPIAYDIIESAVDILRDKANDAVSAKYLPKMEAILVDIGTAAEAAGWRFDGGVVDSSDDETECSIVLRQHRPPEDDEDEPVHDADIDIRFAICKQSNHDVDGPGIAFRLDASTVGGEIIGDMAPHNYSDDAWVDMFDTAAVARRFALFENDAIPDEVVAVCASYSQEV